MKREPNDSEHHVSPSSEDGRSAKITRRQFGEATMAAMVPALMGGTTLGAGQVADPTCEGVEFVSPPVVSVDPDRIARAHFVVAGAKGITIPRNDNLGCKIDDGMIDGNRIYYSVSGNTRIPRVPGPTFRVRGGDAIQLKLTNSLPADEPGKDRNPTNFHTHGLHISPKPPQDDVVGIVIPPEGGEYAYQFEIWENHPPGTHWYHPHKHGSTNIQVQNGMGGTLIVEDYPGTVPPELARAREVILFMQELQNKNPVTDDLMMSSTNSHYFTVNGRVKPVIQARQGELLRLRVINSGVSEAGYVNLALLDNANPPTTKEGKTEFDCGDPKTGCQDLWHIAMDGIYLDAMPNKPVKNLLLAPGNRADFLVRLDRPGKYFLRDLGHDRGGHFMPPAIPGLRVARAAPEEEPRRGRVRAVIVVDGPSLNMPFPRRLPPPSPRDPGFLAPINKVDRCRKVVFDVTPDFRFLIDCKSFDHTRVDQTIALGDAEEWTVINRSDSDHPFHIHVNPFRVTHYNGKKVQERWQDVVNVPGLINARADDPSLEYGSVTFRSRFLRFDGKTVLHCHILSHEDSGMMQLVEIAKGRSDGKPCGQPIMICPKPT